jgi:hypothetical protein
MRDTIELAREAGNDDLFDAMQVAFLERFAALVRADEREIVMNEPLTKENWQRFEDGIRADQDERYKWDVHSCGPTCKRYACVAMREAVEAEREACAKVCDELYWPWHIGDNSGPKECAKAIRARGNT